MDITSYFRINSAVKCEDCGMSYKKFPLDLVLPDDEWLIIHPEGLDGLLCANCIIKRASKVKGCTIVFANLFIKEQ